MAKIIGPLFSMSVSGALGDIVFDRRGFAYLRKGHRDAKSASQGDYRLAMMVAQRGVKLCGPQTRQLLKAMTPTATWHGYLMKHLIGPKRSRYIGYMECYNDPALDQSAWEAAAVRAGLRPIVVPYADQAAASPGVQLFCLASALYGLRLYPDLGQPGDNAEAWRVCIVSGKESVPPEEETSDAGCGGSQSSALDSEIVTAIELLPADAGCVGEVSNGVQSSALDSGIVTSQVVSALPEQEIPETDLPVEPEPLLSQVKKLGLLLFVAAWGLALLFHQEARAAGLAANPSDTDIILSPLASLSIYGTIVERPEFWGGGIIRQAQGNNLLSVLRPTGRLRTIAYLLHELNTQYAIRCDEFNSWYCCNWMENFMPRAKKKKMRVAMPAWEIGRVGSGFGSKIGGLGVVVEELPPELVKAAARQGIELEIETLTPCFAHYDRSQLTRLDVEAPVSLDGYTFAFEVYEYVFPDGHKVIYFWDEWQLSWTNASAIYPSDPQMGIKLYAAVGQAMAAYIKQAGFDTVHLHDYHVGLVPFYLGDDYLRDVPVHLTIHNASYQGITPLVGGGYASLDRLNLPGEKLFHRYFDFFDNLNIMKACMLKVHEGGGKITTVSGDIAGTWGYAAELKENHATLWARAYAQKGSPPGEVFVPNRHLDLFEKLPIAGITNGMSDINRPENLPELKAKTLRQIQTRRGPHNPIFGNPTTQSEMLARDHSFDVNHLEMKAELKRLLHLETFGTEPVWDPILITAVGRLVDQKNLGLAADIIERTLAYDGGTKFIILASAPEGDAGGKATEANFFRLAALYPQRVYFNNSFNQPLSKLILAGGDFTLIPSRFEPCGLVDYEASLVGNVVIGRAIGGLVKVRHCAYLYEWLDISDRAGEANAFFWQVKAAIDAYRHNHAHHDYLLRTAMAINSSWDASAGQYVEMYRYGLLTKRWQASRRELIDQFIRNLKKEQPMFAEFFFPGQQEYADRLDWELQQALL